MRNTFTIWLLCLLCFGFIAIDAFENVKTNGIEDAVLLNPAYMMAHYNQVRFPVYDDFEEGNWTNMYDQPPFHYIVTGISMKFLGIRNGIIIYHLFLLALLFATVLYIKESGLFKIFFLIGITRFVVFSINHTSYSFQVRPEMAITLCWITGVLWLRTAALTKWKLSYTVIGTIIFTLATISHYFAMPGFIGLFIFWLYGYFQFKTGEQKAKPALLISIGVSCLMLCIYFIAFVLPDFHQISLLTFGNENMTGHEHSIYSIGDRLNWHLKVHQLSYPIGIVSALILILFRKTRFIGLLAFPLVFMLTFYLNIKKEYYILPELLLYFLAQYCIVYEIAKWLLNKNWQNLHQSSVGQLSFFIIPVFVLVLYQLANSFSCTNLEVMRTAAQKIVGPGATVSGAHSLWYAAGAYKWRNEDKRILCRGLMSKKEIFTGSDFIAIPSYMPQAKTSPCNQYYCDKMELNGVFTGDINFVIYGKNLPKDHAPIAYNITDTSVSEFTRTDTGTYVIGSIMGYDKFYPKMILPHIKRQYAVPLNSSVAGVCPKYMVFFIARKDSFDALSQTIALDKNKRWEIYDEYRASRKKYSIKAFVTRPAGIKDTILFQRFDEMAEAGKNRGN